MNSTVRAQVERMIADLRAALEYDDVGFLRIALADARATENILKDWRGRL